MARITPSAAVYVHAGCITFHYLQFGLALGIPLATTNKSFFKCRNVGLSGIQSVRYRNEQKFRCWNHSGTGIRIPSPVPECPVTGMRYRMPAYRPPLLCPGEDVETWPHLQSCTKFCRARDSNSCPPDQESQNCNHYVLNEVAARNAVLCSIKNHISDK